MSDLKIVTKHGSNPGDYYKRKEQQAKELRIEIDRHQLDECMDPIFCPTCKRLERELELALYVGD